MSDEQAKAFEHMQAYEGKAAAAAADAADAGWTPGPGSHEGQNSLDNISAGGGSTTSVEQEQIRRNLLITGGTTPGDAFPQPFLGSSYATGGVAGQAGPEVVQVGEQGPELVLNAKQTQQLAQSLGGAPTQAPTQAAPAQGGPSGGGQGAFSQTPEELEAYLEELLNRAG